MQNVKLALLTAACLAVPAAMAQAAESAPIVQHSGTVGELERIQSDTVLYQFRAARSKALLSWQQSGGSGEATLPAPVVTGGPLPAAPVAVSSLPRITEIAGSGHQLRCRLRMADGSMVEASAGQALPGTDYRVSAVTAQSVTVVSADGKPHNLLFSGDQ